MLSIRKLHLINDNDPYKFVDSADSFDSANANFYGHDVTSSFHPTSASYYSDDDRLHFRRNKHVCSENKHRGETQGNVQVNIIPRSLSVSHKLSMSLH